MADAGEQPVFAGRRARSVAGAAGDGPDRLDPLAAIADIPVVEVDGWIAMAGDEAQLLADGERAIALSEPQHAVLVGRAHVFRVLATQEPRHAGIDAHGLEARIEHRALGAGLAHDRGIDEERVL